MRIVLRHEVLCERQADATGPAGDQIDATAAQPAARWRGNDVFGKQAPHALAVTHGQHHAGFLGRRFMPRSLGVCRLEDAHAQERLLTRNGLREAQHRAAARRRADDDVQPIAGQRLQQVQ